MKQKSTNIVWRNAQYLAYPRLSSSAMRHTAAKTFRQRMMRIITLLCILCSFLGLSSWILPRERALPAHVWAAPDKQSTIPEEQSFHIHLPLVNTLPSATGDQAIVFVSRQIPAMGTVYWDVPKGLPGVGPFSRFQVAAPGQLLVREVDGTLRVLVDGATPTAASLHLIDVNAPDVSYDGQEIVFAGLVAGEYDRRPMTNPGAWRIYAIKVDGTGLRQITFSDRDALDLSQFGNIQGQFRAYDDTDPVWLPDGRIVFSSTRWPALAMYGAARTSNLYVVNADGSDLHRITSERNGADRPQIDPLTGRVVYARWWRNFRLPANDMATLPDPAGGYKLKDGLVTANDAGYLGNVPGSAANMNRNAWHLASINPDGTELKLWGIGSSTFLLGEDANFAYGGVFAPDGSFYGNFFPMKNGTEASGFGGIRHYTPGMSGRYTSILGITAELGYELVSQNPASYGVNSGEYAAEPALLPDGRLVIAWAPDIRQDYGLYLINRNGSDKHLLYDNPGTTELRARIIRPRTVPPVIADQIPQQASPLPPTAAGPYDTDGTFTFDARNVYFNAPVDTNIVSAMPVGAAGTIRFFIDHQRDQQTGSLERLEWPILLAELPVNADGAVVTQSPANVPLFEQIRSPQPDYQVPLTGRTSRDFGGAAHVAGLNFGRPGEVQRCVGCHTGHSLIPVPESDEAAQFTNLAPGAQITYSSIYSLINPSGEGLIDRRVLKGRIIEYWRSDPAQAPVGQWVQLTFPVPITVRTVRLYNPRPGDEANSTLQVEAATAILYSDAGATVEVARQRVGPLAVSGTELSFADVRARTVRVVIDEVTGKFEELVVAGLAEVEVIARGEAGP